MLKNLAPPSSNPVQSINDWRDLSAKAALFIFGIVLWHKGSAIAAGSLLILVWILCGGLLQLRSIIKEPLAVAILSLCGVLLLGILWSDWPNSGRFRWDKYFGLMIFIPYLSLLNKDRLFWAGWGLVIGYLGVLLIGLYYQFYLEVSGIPPLKMAYLHFSLVIGIGVLLAFYRAGISENNKIELLLWAVAYLLLFVQINLNGRGPLLTTVVTLFFLLFLLYRRQIKKMISIMVLTASLIGIFSYRGFKYEAQRLT